MWWEIQKNDGWKTLTHYLSCDERVHACFDDFITTFYWRFREKKGRPLGYYKHEINFQGFGGFEFDDNEKRKMGTCYLYNIKEHWIKESEFITGDVKITISQAYLLDKLGMDKLFTNWTQSKNILQTGSIDVSFDNLIGTFAHELAHAYQNTIYLQKKVNNVPISQCESSGEGERDKNYRLIKARYPKLVAEHNQLTAEIKALIIGSIEYQEFKLWWKEQDEERSDNSQPGIKNCENCGKINPYNYCQECSRASAEFNKLVLLIIKSKDPITLEKNWKIIKAHPLYINNQIFLKNDSQSSKTRLDNLYQTSKNYLNKLQNNSTNKQLIPQQLLWGLLIVVIIAFIGVIFWGYREEKGKKRGVLASGK